MKFAIQVNGSVFGSEAGDSAYQFIRAAIERGHEIVRVFFYHEGAYQGMAQVSPPDDEPNPVKRWSELVHECGTDLVICISAAQRRGLLDGHGDLQSGEAPVGRVAPGFRIGGLGQWVDACIRADRVLIFRP
ncbi:MAG: sulfurtransferase [Proteobacteria bacterium]|nr:sulfurtransferase [Pseudomonadota bacterium]